MGRKRIQDRRAPGFCDLDEHGEMASILLVLHLVTTLTTGQIAISLAEVGLSFFFFFFLSFFAGEKSLA